MTRPDAPPMGWYPDPGGSDHDRYWDGESWTHNLRDREPAPDDGEAKPSSTPSSPAGFNWLDPYPPQDGTTAPGQTPSGTSLTPGAAAPPSSQVPGAAPPQGGIPAGPLDSRTGTSAGPMAYPGAPVVHPSALAWQAHTGPTTADGVPLAGWWWRVLASVIDWVPIAVLTSMLGWSRLQHVGSVFADMYRAAYDAAQAGKPSPDPTPYANAMTGDLTSLSLISVVATVVYLLLCYLTLGRSLGNLATGTHLVPVSNGAHRGRLRVPAALARSLTIGVLLLVNVYAAVVWPVNCLIPLFARKRQALHDMASSTQVVRPGRAQVVIVAAPPAPYRPPTQRPPSSAP